MKQHPLYYILASLTGILAGGALLELISAAWNDPVFWQLTGLAVLGLIGALSIDLFIRVSRIYPLLRCIRTPRSTSQHSKH